MPFCPNCKAEFQIEINECTDCAIALVSSLDDPHLDQEMGDVYICYEPVEASRIADMLRDAGLVPFIRDRSSGAFPTTAGTGAEHHIAVLSNQYSQAHQLISTAIEDKVISEDGRLV